MTLRKPQILFVFLLGFLCACTSESERILNDKIDNVEFTFSDLRMGTDNISWKTKESIQYGFIHLNNGEQVKFWFLTHHATSDIGGTIYEYPNGEKQFCSGLHCCEVQFYENGKLGKAFENASELKAYVTEKSGNKP
jgi:hypothetical protein